MKKARMNISHLRFILFNFKIFAEIVATKLFLLEPTSLEFTLGRSEKMRRGSCFSGKIAKAFNRINVPEAQTIRFKEKMTFFSRIHLNLNA